MPELTQAPDPHLNPETAARAHAHAWHLQFYPHRKDIVDPCALAILNMGQHP
jgi:hypothetical protein